MLEWKIIVQHINKKKGVGRSYKKELLELKNELSKSCTFDKIQIYNILLHEENNIEYVYEIIKMAEIILSENILNRSDIVFMVSLFNRALIYAEEDINFIKYKDIIRLNPIEIINYLLVKTKEIGDIKYSLDALNYAVAEEHKKEVLDYIFSFYSEKSQDIIIDSFKNNGNDLGLLILDVTALEKHIKNYRDTIILKKNNLSDLYFIGIQCMKINYKKHFVNILKWFLKLESILSSEEINIIKSMLTSVEQDEQLLQYLDVNTLISSYLVTNKYKKIVELRNKIVIGRGVLFHAYLKLKNYDEAELLYEEELLERYETIKSEPFSDESELNYDEIKTPDKNNSIDKENFIEKGKRKLNNTVASKNQKKLNTTITLKDNQALNTEETFKDKKSFIEEEFIILNNKEMPKTKIKPKHIISTTILEDDLFEFYLETEKNTSALNILNTVDENTFIELIKKIYYKNLKENKNKLILESLSIGIQRFGSKNLNLIKILISFLHLEGIKITERIPLLIKILERIDCKGEEEWIYSICYNTVLDLLEIRSKDIFIILEFCFKLVEPTDEFFYLYLYVIRTYKMKENKVKTFYSLFQKLGHKTNETYLLFYEYFLSNDINVWMDIFNSLSLNDLTDPNIKFLLLVEESTVHDQINVRIKILKEAHNRNILSKINVENIFINVTYYGPLAAIYFIKELNFFLELKDFMTDNMKNIIKNQKEIIAQIKGYKGIIE